MDKVKREREIQRQEKLKASGVYGKRVHGFMLYECENCGAIFEMWLEEGLEDKNYTGDLHKPVPYIIGCRKCNAGNCKHVHWEFDTINVEYRPLLKGMSYFKNTKDSDCGVSVMYPESAYKDLEEWMVYGGYGGGKYSWQ